MDDHLEKRLHGSAAQIHGSVGECRVHLLQLGHDVQNDVRQAKGHVRQQQCPEIQGFPLTQHAGTHEDEQQGQADTGDDVGIGHRDVGQTQNKLAHSGLQTVDTDGSHGAEGHGNAGRQQGDQNGVAQQAKKVSVPEQFHVLLEGKPFKFGDILTGVEGCHDQHCHGDIQKDKDQDGNDAVRSFHTTTPSSSPPKRFMMPVQIKTSAISTRLSAAPRLGLSPCLNHFSMISPIKMVS